MEDFHSHYISNQTFSFLFNFDIHSEDSDVMINFVFLLRFWARESTTHKVQIFKVGERKFQLFYERFFLIHFVYLKIKKITLFAYLLHLSFINNRFFSFHLLSSQQR
jgi:hypothetical protein